MGCVWEGVCEEVCVCGLCLEAGGKMGGGGGWREGGRRLTEGGCVCVREGRGSC